MRKCRFLFLSSFLALVVSGASANWQYDGTYVGDGWYTDDGSRFTMSFRGGASYSMGTIENEMGSLVARYYYDPATSQVIPDFQYNSCVENGGCETYELLGDGDLGTLPAAKDLDSFAVAAGASLGWTVPNRPQWRLEIGWDHIDEAEYNASPLFEGELVLSGGTAGDVVALIETASVQSKITTDIFSVMAFYDFYDGLQKPLRTVIPYIGFGAGYADITTKMTLTDKFGDLSYDADLLEHYGEWNDFGIIQFYPSKTQTSTIAGIVAAGMSYGITETMFLDFGARVMYVPKIKWALQGKDGERSRDWFSAKNAIYANVMLGLRFEF